MTLRTSPGTRKTLQAVDSSSENGEPRGRKRKIRLANAKDVRRELAAVYRAQVNGELDMATAKGRAYILDMMRAAIETDEIEQKLEQLEQRAEEM
ncbi:hypothetical protein [Burkholderia pseudomallei]|uniref:hypothetical protein n=2 Tax=Burkholderia pseudomallei TaxID=28450 RepID=UPI000C9AE79D|nr:hypothetical protein [Burkholderia pseudomallei]